MTTLFKRQVFLNVSNPGQLVNPGIPGVYKPGTGGDGFNLSDLHIQFHVVCATSQSLKHAVIRVWNLSRDNATKVMNEFTKITLLVGYEGVNGDGEPMRTLIDGQIAEVRSGSEDAVNSYLEMIVQDGDMGANNGSMSKTISDGWTDDDVLNTLLPEWKNYQVTLGYKPTFTTTPGPRDKVLHGGLRELTTELAKRQGCDWFIEDGQLNFVPRGKSIPGQAIQISTTGGMIGVPIQTYQGIEARCLMNPAIRVGRTIQIENAAINVAKRNTPVVGVTNAGDVFPSLNAPTEQFGSYRVGYLEHSGDTRGNQWETYVICTSIDGTQPNSGPAIYGVDL
ncbi:baseplate hub protein [Solilutibacter silvestris]|uniref:baseplate hub protein n=1 Tax=Solilutibacter silvestris TaxID=1645665 RepID=UPI003D3557B2